VERDFEFLGDDGASAIEESLRQINVDSQSARRLPSSMQKGVPSRGGKRCLGGIWEEEASCSGKTIRERRPQDRRQKGEGFGLIGEVRCGGSPSGLEERHEGRGLSPGEEKDFLLLKTPISYQKKEFKCGWAAF